MTNEPTIYMWKKFWQYSEGNRKNVVLFIVLTIIANFFMFLFPLLIAHILNIIQVEGVTDANIKKLILLSCLFTVLGACFWAFHGPSRVLETKNAYSVRINYKKYLVDGVLSMPAEWHAEHHSGDTIDKIEKGSQALYSFSQSTFEIIESLFRFISSIIVLLYFNLTSGLLVFIFVFLAVEIVLRYDDRLRVERRKINLGENKVSQKIFDIISNITTVIILRMEKVASSQIYQKLIEQVPTFSEFTKTNEIKWFLVSLCTNLTTTVVLVAYLVKANMTGEAVLIGTIYALYGYAERISGVFFRFAYKYSDITKHRTALENSEILSKDFITKDKSSQIKFGKWKSLNIDHLTFSYHSNKEELHLRDINIKINRGEKIAFIGESGSGKTTFLKLIRGLYNPKKLELRLGDNNLHSFEQISDEIALIPQDPELFTTTIKENITLGLDSTDKEIKKYTDLACFTRVVERLPHKLESNINEKGVNLSGGEKQRLALSRGLLACQDKQIILLDEPTSSVDSKNEMDIYKNIFKEFNDKTVISTIHRLHLLSLFDTIYLFDKGRIIASGNLKEIRKSSKFKELWKKYSVKD